MTIRLRKIVLVDGVGTSVVRGHGGVVTDQYATLWYANGFVWVKLRTGGETRCYHPASVEMYPYDEDVPAAPAPPEAVPAPKLKAAGVR